MNDKLHEILTNIQETRGFNTQRINVSEIEDSLCLFGAGEMYYSRLLKFDLTSNPNFKELFPSYILSQHNFNLDSNIYYLIYSNSLILDNKSISNHMEEVSSYSKRVIDNQIYNEKGKKTTLLDEINTSRVGKNIDEEI